jgi:hypothetical protein
VQPSRQEARSSSARRRSGLGRNEGGEVSMRPSTPARCLPGTLVAEMKMNLDKTQVARRHLGTALALFLDDLDPVSVHTLACAGCEVVEHLTRKAGVEPFSTSRSRTALGHVLLEMSNQHASLRRMSAKSQPRES